MSNRSSSHPEASPINFISRGRAPAGGDYTAKGHTCALQSGGTVACWGYNGYGQLGNGSTANAETPVNVPGLGVVAALSAGEHHTCALLASGAVACWGDNTYGQLGDGSSVARSSTPVSVSGLSGVTAISARGHHTCALLAGGTVACWGRNQVSQLGDGTTAPYSPTPVNVGNLTGVTALAAGALHTCALLTGGVVECWGDNTRGELGGGTSAAVSATPVTVVW